MRAWNPILGAALLAAGLAASPAAFAGDVVVIVNKNNANAIDRSLIAKIFTGEAKSWPDGTGIVAVDLTEDNPTYQSFVTDVVGKTPGSLKAAWASLMFSGKATPPKKLGSDEDVRKFVASTNGAIGYVKAASVDGTVKAALK
jgi:ABC-type phosphate transport system substrate-binding protein